MYCCSPHVFSCKKLTDIIIIMNKVMYIKEAMIKKCYLLPNTHMFPRCLNLSLRLHWEVGLEKVWLIESFPSLFDFSSFEITFAPNQSLGRQNTLTHSGWVSSCISTTAEEPIGLKYGCLVLSEGSLSLWFLKLWNHICTEPLTRETLASK